MTLPSLSKKQKYLTGAALATCLVLLLVGNIIAGRYKAIIERTLPIAVADATDSLYHITFKKVSINLLNRRVRLTDVHIWADSAMIVAQYKDSSAKKNYYDITIPRLQVSGIMWDKLVGGAGYSCGTVSLKQPGIVIRKTPKQFTQNTKQRKTAATKDFSAGKIRVTKAALKYIAGTADTANTIILNNLTVSLNDWLYNKNSINDTTRFLLAEYSELNAGTLTYEPPNTFYKFTAKALEYNTDDNKLVAKDLSLKPTIGQEEIWKQQFRQKEIYNINFPTIEFAGIDRQRLLQDRELHVSDIYLNHSDINVYLNRMLPENTESKMGRFPNQLIQKAKLPLNIQRIVVNNGSVTYTEKSDKTQKEAAIHFDKINGNVKNITNIPAWLAVDDNCIAKLDCKFNKKSDVSAFFNLSLTDAAGAFAMNLDIQGLQGRQLTEQTKALSLLEVKSLNMRSMQVRLTGNEVAAKSEFTMLYNNLGIRILTEEKNLHGNKKKKGFISFIANNMILYSSNPMPGEKVRSINTYVERDQMKSFFNLIWKNILNGVRETTIRDMSVIRWLQKNEKKKQSAEDNNHQPLRRSKRKARPANN